MIEARRARSWVAIFAACVCAVALLVSMPATVAPVTSAEAANASDWNAGNIIDDAVFYDSNAMGSPEIQAFMEQQVRSCRPGYTCLPYYRQNTDNRPADRYCDGYSGRANESASTIIDRVARSCGISQKVLLVLLEKEQSLVTSTAPSAWSYSAATGQGCPDTAPCDSATAGFFYQVYYAARQYEIYRLNPTSWGYQAGRWNNILYSPYSDRGCGTARVFIENQATAGLYIYTPYTPNAAALRNMYGEGDGCSAYGNRNFWRIFTDWFGSTRASSVDVNSPIGNVEVVRASPGQFEVGGWVLDPNSADPIAVHVYVGSAGTAISADRDRPDVGAAYPGAGSRHGFSATIPATGGGMTDVCLYAINTGPGSTAFLGCRSIAAMSGSPFGYMESVAPKDGAVSVSGWAIDPDTAAPTAVHVYVDGTGVAVAANGDRPDLRPHYPAYGTAHGFSTTVAATPGPHTVCSYAINIAAGGNVQLGCTSVVVPGQVDLARAPIGSYEALTVSGNTATASGWAIDPDTTASIQVHLYVGSAGQAFTAGRSRPDVAAAYPGYGAAHGFAEKVTLVTGKNDVCAYAMNTGAGGHTFLGCRTVTVAAPAAVDRGRVPFGNFEAVIPGSGSATVSGWAVDPDTTEPIAVHVYVDQTGAAFTADDVRADVARAYGLGDRHGFGEVIPMSSGSHNVCVYAINNGAGGHVLLGCRTVVVR